MSLPYNDLILNAGKEAIFIVKDGMIKSCNPYAGKLFHCNNIGDSKRKIKELFIKDDHDKIDDITQSDQAQSIEAVALKLTGEPFDVEVFCDQAMVEESVCYIFSIRDISGFKQSQRELLSRDALLESINFLAAKFLESKNWQQDIEAVLSNLGKSARVSRVYIFQNFHDEAGRLYMSQKHEWVANHITSEIENPVLGKLYYHENGLDRLIEVLSVGEVYKGLVKDLPPEERQVLEAQDILSIFITPIFQNGKWWGFIGFDECTYERQWTPHEIKLLNTAADLFTSALDRESMEARISRINNNFKTLFDHSPDAVFVYDYNANILDVNKAACVLNGFSRNELIGKHVSDLVPDDMKTEVTKEFGDWITGENKIIESESKNSKGDLVPVEIRGAQITYFEEPAVLLLVRNISKRKQSEALLKKRIEFIRFISEISSEFIKIDLKEIEAAMNRALQYVCNFTSTQRGYFFQIDESETSLSLTNEYCAPGLNTHKEILDSFLVHDFNQYINTLKNGEIKISHFDELPEDDENTRLSQVFEMLDIKSCINIPLAVGDYFIGFIGFDSTLHKASWDKETINVLSLTGQIFANTIKRQKTEDDLIEAKNKAEQSDRLKTAFLGQMSHEMRTPLNSIIGFADMLERDILQQDLKEMAGFIVQGGARLLNTFNLVIDLSEIEANTMQTNMHELELNAFIRNIVPSFANRAYEKNLLFKFLPLKSEIYIIADEGLFEKVIHNLVDNAIKYTHEGSIKIETNIFEEQENSRAVIKIVDTGIGIPKDKINDIFNRFRQASEGYNREFEGVGLGLSVTKGMVELMDGKINVVSIPGKGAEFEIKMPLAPSRPTKNVNDQAGFSKSKQAMPKILVVEDEVVHQRYIDYIMKKRYLLHFADNAAKAQELVENEKFDLLILDINLGREMNGMELINQIRQIEGYEQIPAIAATANVMKGHRELFLSKGFTHYLAKPYKSNDLLELVAEILTGEKVKK